MKKAILLLAVFALTFTTLQSQEKAFSKGSNAINIGIGFGNTIYTGYGMGIPRIAFSYERGIVEIPMGSKMTGVIGVGGMVGWDQMSSNLHWGGYWGDYKSTINAFFIGARGNYHFIFVDKLDLYAGLILGFYFGNQKYDWDTSTPGAVESVSFSNFYPGGYVGARYYFNPKFAVYSELGRNISIFSLGVTLGF